MLIVLDTNVVVSGLLNETGVPARVIDLCIAGDVDVAVDSRIMLEYEDVLRRMELALDQAEVRKFLEWLELSVHVVAAPLPLNLPDPGDLPFLEVAVAAAVDAIVTGNVKHFRAREGPVDIPILTPRQLLDRLR